jgi:glucosamine-6-phosphate deaminase
MGGPRLLVVDDADELGRVAADLVSDAIALAPSASVIPATGRTPMKLYAYLAARRAAGLLSTSEVTAVQLDEYLGLADGDRRSLFGWMERSFLEPLGIADERITRLPLDGDLDAACAAYDRDRDARGPVDLAILGMGENGHLGFNEPPSGPEAVTRPVELSPTTIFANAGYWGSAADVPTRAVTMGLRHLLAARTIVLLVSGRSKRGIVHRALEDEIGPDVPASFLREAEGDVTVVVDRAAWGAE